MSYRKPLSIGEKSFKTRKDANLFAKKLLNSQPIKVPIPEPQHSFLVALLFLHPRAKEKIGPGVRNFTVEHARHGTRCCYVTRIDGSKAHFSYLKCTRAAE